MVQKTITINGLPWLPMNHLVDDTFLQKLDLEVCLGLAQAKNDYMSTLYASGRGDVPIEIHPTEYKESTEVENSLTAEEINLIKNFDLKTKQRFLKFYKQAYHPWAFCYDVIPSSWTNRDVPINKTVPSEALKLFPTLIKWAFGIGIFKSIGRIAIFGVDVNQPVICHRDLDPNKSAQDCNLLMISPKGNKKFYIYDQEKQEKLYVKDNVWIFHDFNFHGADAVPYFNYTIRIDGKYTNEFAQTINYDRKGQTP